MFFTIDQQKIEIDSYCRKFPPAPRSPVRCPALAAKVKPSPAVSYFFVQFLLQIFPCSRRAALGNPLWDSPLFRPVSPGFSPENHTVFRPSSQRTPQNGRKNFPRGSIRPSVVFIPWTAPPPGVTIWFYPFCFSSLSTKPPPFLFRTSCGFPGYPRYCTESLSSPPPTHCMICWIFTFGAMLFASLQRSPFSLPGLSTTVSWIFVGFFSGPTALSSVFSPVDASHFPGDFMAKSFHFKYSLPNLSLSDGHFFLLSILFLLSCHTLLAKTTGFFVNRVIG